jgi:hypothetical protein
MESSGKLNYLPVLYNLSGHITQWHKKSYKLAGSFVDIKVKSKFYSLCEEFLNCLKLNPIFHNPDLWEMNSLFEDFLSEICNYSGFKDSWMTIETPLFHDLQILQGAVNYTWV